jgi:hypothetical protein
MLFAKAGWRSSKPRTVQLLGEPIQWVAQPVIWDYTNQGKSTCALRKSQPLVSTLVGWLRIQHSESSDQTWLLLRCSACYRDLSECSGSTLTTAQPPKLTRAFRLCTVTALPCSPLRTTLDQHPATGRSHWSTVPATCRCSLELSTSETKPLCSIVRAGFFWTGPRWPGAGYRGPTSTAFAPYSFSATSHLGTISYQPVYT